MRFISLFALLAISLGLGSVLAQQPGTQRYNTVTLPAHGMGDTIQQGQWERRWGALALSSVNNLSGFALDYRTKEQAEEAALAHCRSRGGVDCIVEANFDNSCVAIATSDVHSRWVQERTLRKARREALRNCGSGCRILWEGCTLPERVQ